MAFLAPVKELINSVLITQPLSNEFATLQSKLQNLIDIQNTFGLKRIETIVNALALSLVDHKELFALLKQPNLDKDKIIKKFSELESILLQKNF